MAAAARDADEEADELPLLAMFDAELPVREVVVALPRGGAALRVLAAAEERGASQSGAYLWPAARFFVARLLDEACAALPPHGGGALLELGAGVGLVGVALAVTLREGAAQCGAPAAAVVVCTDREPAVLARVAENAQRNGVAARLCTETLFWGAAGRSTCAELRARYAPDGFDVLVGADLLYCADVGRYLGETAALLLRRTARARLVVVSSFRSAGHDALVAECRARGLACQQCDETCAGLGAARDRDTFVVHRISWAAFSSSLGECETGEAPGARGGED